MHAWLCIESIFTNSTTATSHSQILSGQLATQTPIWHQPVTQGPCSYAPWEISILAKLPIYAKLYLTRQSAQYTMYLVPEPRSWRYLIPVYPQRLASFCCPDISLLHSACQHCIEPDLVGQLVTQTPVHRTDLSLLPNAPPAMQLEKNTFLQKFQFMPKISHQTDIQTQQVNLSHRHQSVAQTLVCCPMPF